MNAPPAAEAVSVLVVDDQPAMRAALRTILEADDITVVGEAGDGEGAVRRCGELSPDVVLMDVRMPGVDGIAATSTIVRSATNARVLVLTTFDDDHALFGALRAGAAGFLLKNAGPEALQRAVRAVAEGDAVLDPAVVARVMRRFAHVEVPRTDVDIERLTEREKDVLALLASGASNAEVADALGIGEATAKTHVSRVILKLGVRDRLQAVIRAHECGFARAPRAVQRRVR